jgi:hypothetical protein
MAWENIQDRLKKALTVKVSLPGGIISLPDTHLTIDEWLTSIVETDEELRVLNNVPRIRFLQNRWQVEELLELEWDDDFANKKSILAMYAGQRAYIVFHDWSEFQVIAAVEPKDNKSLYRAVIGKLLENRSFVPASPGRIRNRRPDLVPEFEPVSRVSEEEQVEASVQSPQPQSSKKRWQAFLSDILVGWIGRWLTLPEAGFWHHDEVPKKIEYKRAA